MMTRREFLKNTLMAGLPSALFLASCEQMPEAPIWTPQPVKKPTHILWFNEAGSGTFYQCLVDFFNALGYSVYVTQHEIQDYKALSDALGQRNPPDLVSLDIVWVHPFASNHLIVPLTVWSKQEQADYFQKAWEVVTVEDMIYAAPFRLDLGMLFYRNDLVTKRPRIWGDLANQARALQRKNKVKYGYVWQGGAGTDPSNRQYGEGLFCNYLEVLYGFGGSFDIDKPETITSSQAQEALSTMVGWINDISPQEVLDSYEDKTTGFWENGEAAFMRNWPYDDAGSATRNLPIGNAFAVTSLLTQSAGQISRSCLGG